jgi:hypothetical protein
MKIKNQMDVLLVSQIITLGLLITSEILPFVSVTDIQGIIHGVLMLLNEKQEL